MKPGADHQAGFSLLETLLGLTLTAMIGVLMMGSMQMGVRVWERDRGGEQPGEEQLLLSQTGEWIAQALPARPRSVEEPAFAPFAGDVNSVSFLYSAPGLGASPGIYEIALQLVASESCQQGRRLMMSVARMAPAEASTEASRQPPELRELASCIPSPSFAFWGGTAEEPEADWRQTWRQQMALPALVRLSSSLPDGAERVVFTQQILGAKHP